MPSLEKDVWAVLDGDDLVGAFLDKANATEIVAGEHQNPRGRRNLRIFPGTFTVFVEAPDGTS